jgi:hypothetical protein
MLSIGFMRVETDQGRAELKGSKTLKFAQDSNRIGLLVNNFPLAFLKEI